MVEGGMPPFEALLSACVNTADLLRITEQVGTVSAGKWADLIAVKGNPVEDITEMQRVQFVMKEGRVYKKGGQAHHE